MVESLEKNSGSCCMGFNEDGGNQVAVTWLLAANTQSTLYNRCSLIIFYCKKIHCSKKLKEHFFIRVWHDFNCTDNDLVS